jgi:3'(2'), 5'-bisphosphate nucleotidase
MLKINLKKITEDLIPSFYLAGKESIKLSGKNLKITIKKDNTPVTNGDLAVDKILQDKISKLTPNIQIVSEENVNEIKKFDNNNFWLIDPIDGTREYIKNKNEYTLNAALILNKKPAIGIIYAPKLERLFYSYKKNCAFEINKDLKKKLKCKKLTKKNEILALSNSLIPSDIILNIHQKYNVTKFVKCSSSLKFCLIAAGEFDIYVARTRAKEWDIAAGHAIAEHAGAILTTFSGKKIIYGKKNFANPTLLLKRSNNLLK